MHPYLHTPTSVVPCGQWIEGKTHTDGQAHTVNSPYTGKPMAQVFEADSAIVDRAVQAARKAQPAWGATPIKERTQVMFRFRDELLKNADAIVATKSFESGKTPDEARAGLMKGVEVLEFALSLQNSDAGQRLEVSRGVFCETRRIPVGVVAGITPFNFPAMVPLWMIPIALTLGNAFIWKPSDKTPMTSLLIAQALQRAGLPEGVFAVIQGGKDAVHAILDHPGISSVGFVGSTAVAKQVYQRGTSHLKRVLALGGAKNHIVLMPDADPHVTALGIRDSFTGCAGQRCMAASVLLAVGPVDKLIEEIAQKTSQIVPGKTMGAIITAPQVQFLKEAVGRATKDGAKALLDGTGFKATGDYAEGNWLAPTILDQVKPGSEAATRELFGPVLSIVRCKSLEEALAIEAKNPYGNATSVFTSDGATAEEVARRSISGMVGINIGVPVPREPFSFGGLRESKFGQGDITGVHSLDLWSNPKKITTKWSVQADRNWMS